MKFPPKHDVSIFMQHVSGDISTSLILRVTFDLSIQEQQVGPF